MKSTLLSVLIIITGFQLRSQQYFDTNGILNKQSFVTVTPEDIGINADSLHNGIERIITEAIDSGAFPGCQVLLVKDGMIFYEQAFGYHTYDSLIPVRTDDIYDLASVTKTTAATLALMKLSDEGIFDVNSTFGEIFPDYRHTNKADLPMRDVLAHQAGLRAWIPYWSESKRKNGSWKPHSVSEDSSKNFNYKLSDANLFLYRKFREKKIYKMIRKSPVSDQKEYLYSGLTFYLIPDYVQRMTAQPFDTFLESNFYRPLGAETLVFNAGELFPLERIAPTEVDNFFRMDTLHGIVHDEGAAMMKGVSGNAGLFSNARDLGKVYQMLLNGGTYHHRRFLSEEVIHTFTRCQFCDSGNRRGLGFDKPLIEYDSLRSSVAEKASPESFGHTGYTGTLVWADPKNDLLFVFMSNRVYPTRNNSTIYRLNVRPRIHNLVYDLLD
ncbi:serine hydrolase domain-containing protein [Fulvivirga sedimenti]|uniref:Serine hydrolase n=1 Tax=Fulvivirga sedimenti TaxID=2879465 RepID=A0A9X1HKY9_9BACT|nr:serine hydrolase [Fulvivirga sedimenti]MCA6073241.1 serine hydrolase [Fulvivirga sedimenti]